LSKFHFVVKILNPELVVNDAKQPQDDRYHLQCKIVVKHLGFKDFQSRGHSQVEDTMVFLVPVESTQRDLFLMAWVPDSTNDAHEIGLLLGSPVSGPARACVKRRNEWCEDHHIMMMSESAEKELHDFNGREVGVTVLAQSEAETYLT
jgi:hypothetical protein